MSFNLEMNAGNWIYYQGLSPLLNWRYICNPIIIHRTVGGDITGTAAWNAGYFDATTGELVNPVPSDVVSITRTFYGPPQQPAGNPGNNYSGETWFSDFTGSSTVSFGGTSASAHVSGNKYSYTTDGSLASITHTITNVNDPPRNVRLWQTRYDTNVTNGETWCPDWLALIGQFGVIRTMDAQQTNNCWLTDFSQFADFTYGTVGGYFGVYFTQFTGPIVNCDVGPKGNVHPNVLCSLANAANTALHVCIPLHATDACVDSIATAYKAGTTHQVIYELCNECWNGGFEQYYECITLGTALGLWPGDAALPFKYYGYRAAQVMKRINDVYGSGLRSRWQGALATQAVNVSIGTANLSGAQQYLTTVGKVVSDVFDDLYIATYIGAGVTSSQMSSIIKNTTTQLKFSNDVRYTIDPANGNVVNGQTVSIQVLAYGAWAGISGKYTTAVMNDPNTVTIPFNSTGLPAFSQDGSYMTASGIFDLVTQSVALNGSQPTRYPTVNQYFDEQMRSILQTGTCPFGVDYGGQVGINYMVSTVLPAQLASAAGSGLGLACYEGANTQTEDGTMAAFGGSPVLTVPLMSFAASLECSEAVGAIFQAVVTAGAHTPSKFEFEGPLSQFGPWSCYRWPPLASNSNVGDNNPVLTRCEVANNGNRMIKLIL